MNVASLNPRPYVFAMAALTDPGRKRSNNEDAADINTIGGVAVLADGMGAHAAGEIASRFAVTRFMCEVPVLCHQAQAPDTLASSMRALAQQVNNEMLAYSQQHTDCEGMGSTVVVAVPCGEALLIGHLGDSRAYLYRAGQLTRLTQDHKWLDEQVAMGLMTPEQARQSRQTNALTRALGIEEEVDMVVHVHELHDDDVILLCTDGLSDMLADEAILQVLTHGSGYPAATAQNLIDLANQMGGKDNIGVVLMRAHQVKPSRARRAY